MKLEGIILEQLKHNSNWYNQSLSFISEDSAGNFKGFVKNDYERF